MESSPKGRALLGLFGMLALGFALWVVRKGPWLIWLGRGVCAGGLRDDDDVVLLAASHARDCVGRIAGGALLLWSGQPDLVHAQGLERRSRP